MFTIRKQFKFEAAHVLDSSFSKCCQQIHGHSYRVELFFRSKDLNADGMVMDFGEVKEKIAHIIGQFDHAMIVGPKNSSVVHGQRLQLCVNPTAENMARDFFDTIKKLIPQLCKVRVHETDTGYAEYERD
jgi:6-pyruvoyltetrahydropterin/6-carboxytetrahydropterin synthase